MRPILLFLLVTQTWASAPSWAGTPRHAKAAPSHSTFGRLTNQLARARNTLKWAPANLAPQAVHGALTGFEQAAAETKAQLLKAAPWQAGMQGQRANLLASRKIHRAYQGLLAEAAEIRANAAAMANAAPPTKTAPKRTRQRRKAGITLKQGDGYPQPKSMAETSVDRYGPKQHGMPADFRRHLQVADRALQEASKGLVLGERIRRELSRISTLGYSADDAPDARVFGDDYSSDPASIMGGNSRRQSLFIDAKGAGSKISWWHSRDINQNELSAVRHDADGRRWTRSVSFGAVPEFRRHEKGYTHAAKLYESRTFVRKSGQQVTVIRTLQERLLTNGLHQVEELEGHRFGARDDAPVHWRTVSKKNYSKSEVSGALAQ